MNTVISSAFATATFNFFIQKAIYPTCFHLKINFIYLNELWLCEDQLKIFHIRDFNLAAHYYRLNKNMVMFVFMSGIIQIINHITSTISQKILHFEMVGIVAKVFYNSINLVEDIYFLYRLPLRINMYTHIFHSLFNFLHKSH